MIVQLSPTPEQARILKTTLEQHTACFNVVAREGYTMACSDGVELHKRTYYPLRAEFPDLPAQLVCAARVKATEAVKSALTWKVKKEQAYPKQIEKAKGSRLNKLNRRGRSLWANGIVPLAMKRISEQIQGRQFLISDFRASRIDLAVLESHDR